MRGLAAQRKAHGTALRRREILEQIWFCARKSIFPTIMPSIPYTVPIVSVLNTLPVEIGAGGLSGASAEDGGDPGRAGR